MVIFTQTISKLSWLLRLENPSRIIPHSVDGKKCLQRIEWPWTMSTELGNQGGGTGRKLHLICLVCLFVFTFFGGNHDVNIIKSFGKQYTDICAWYMCEHNRILIPR